MSSVSVEVWFAVTADETAQSDYQAMQNWLGANWVYQPQGSGDLGDRMAQAFEAAFAAGMERVVTIGTDCPELETIRLAQAFRMLQTHDLVLGPATDGGYYLIGLRHMIPELFADISWSTAQVLEQTIAIAARLNLTVAYLDPLTDIDRPEDLPIWQNKQRSPKILAPIISIIIPTLNEAAAIQATLSSIQLKSAQHPVEVIVVDGGSQDQTVALARRQAKVICASSGRAQQMNAGAQIAAGEVLLFLHADTHLPEAFVPMVRQTLAQANTIAGAFKLKIEAALPGLRLVEWGANWRSHWFQLPYGDQAIFVKAATFKALGGFAEVPIMEDFEFIRRLQTQGKVAIAPAAVLTSGRRWQKLGVLKTTLINQMMIIAYFLGIPLNHLAQWYRGRRS